MTTLNEDVEQAAAELFIRASRETDPVILKVIACAADALKTEHGAPKKRGTNRCNYQK